MPGATCNIKLTRVQEIKDGRLGQAVKLGHETTIFGFSTSKCIHLPPFTLLQLHNMSEHPGENL